MNQPIARTKILLRRRKLGSVGCCALPLAFLASTAVGTGCATENDTEPPAVTIVDAGTDGGGGDAAAPRRTVERRNPFGNVAKTDNLLWDGDFEWSTPFADQYAWFTGKSGGMLGYDQPTIVLGAQCASGIKCASLEPKMVLVAVGVASQSHALDVSFVARTGAGTCDGAVTALLFTSDPSEPEVSIPLDSAGPDARGYCTYRALIAERHGTLYLYIKNGSGSAILVDNAVVERASAERSVRKSASWPSPLSAESMAKLRTDVRRLMLPREPRPTPAAGAFADQLRGEL